jgi:hypothetical protein
MNKLRTGFLGLALLAAAVAGTAQTDASARHVNKASPQLMTGKVTQVDAGAKTFTIAAGGKMVVFHAAKLRALPQVGDTVDVTYTGSPGAPLEASNLNYSKSN